MDDPSSIISAIVSFSLSGCFALLKRAQVTFSRAKLELLLPNSTAKKRFKSYQAKASQMVIASTVWGSFANFIFILSVLTLFADQGQLKLEWTLYALLFSAVVLIIFGKAIPEAMVRGRAERIMLHFLPCMNLLYYTLIWIVGPVHWLAQSIDRVFGKQSLPTDTAVIEKEILSVVSEGEREGVFQESEKEMIAGIIELRDSEVTEVMTPRTDMVSIQSTATLAQAIKLSLEKGHSRIPVYRENRDDIIGILYIKDLLQYWEDEKRQQVQLTDVLRKPFFVPETKRIGSLLAEFQSQKRHIAIVLDEYGGTAGLVTIEDIIEEIVGEIRDEYDSEEETILQRVDDRTVEVDAKLHVDELNSALGIELPQGNGYETVGGFLFNFMGRIPAKGETYQHQNVSFTILDASERKIKRVKVVVDRSVEPGES